MVKAQDMIDSSGRSTTASLARRRDDFFKGDATTTQNGSLSKTVNGSSGDTYTAKVSSQQFNETRTSPPSMRYPLKRDYSTAATVRELQSYVGFANIPNQVYRRAIKQGFDFTLMVVGQSGLGKSTFINSLFLTDVYPTDSSGVRTYPKTVQIQEHTMKMNEKGVTLNLTLVDTPGFGDAVDNSKCWDPVIQFVDRNFAHFFSEETKIQRKDRIPDKRVHCCLYFISPSGHGLKPLDIEFMKQLHDRVNIIPIIAKADTMTAEELSSFKRTISREIAENHIKIYEFPDPDDEDQKRELLSLKARVPFAVIGSNLIQESETGKKVRCRKYPWGTVEVENLDHNDFIALRDMIIRTHLIDLIDVTKSVHYENFRCRQVMKNPVGAVDSCDAKDPFTQIEHEKRDHAANMAKRKSEMEAVLQQKSKERAAAMNERATELEKEKSSLSKRVETLRQELEQKRSKLIEIRHQYPQLPTYDSKGSLSSGASIEPNRSRPSSLSNVLFGPRRYGVSPENKMNKKKSGTLSGVFGRHRHEEH